MKPKTNGPIVQKLEFDSCCWNLPHLSFCLLPRDIQLLYVVFIVSLLCPLVLPLFVYPKAASHLVSPLWKTVSVSVTFLNVFFIFTNYFSHSLLSLVNLLIIFCFFFPAVTLLLHGYTEVYFPFSCR